MAEKSTRTAETPKGATAENPRNPKKAAARNARKGTGQGGGPQAQAKQDGRSVHHRKQEKMGGGGGRVGYIFRIRNNKCEVGYGLKM